MTDAALAIAIARADAGLPVDPVGLPPPARQALALAERLGAPRGPALRAAAAAEAADLELRRAVDVAAAEGRSVARALVVAPPLVGPLTALLVTDDPFAVWSTPVGRVVLLLAGALWLTGSATVHLLVRRATRPPSGGLGPAPEVLDRVVIALAGGAGLPTALRLSDGGHRARAVALWLELGAHGAPPAWPIQAAVLAAARRDGVALAPVVEGVAARARAVRHQTAMERAARLGAQLTLPTTLLLLPAALLVVAAPVLHGTLALVA